VTRVAPHGLYAALMPVPGSRTAEGYGDAYFHGTPSYAHLEEVPSTYPRSAFRCQNEMNYEYVRAGYARPATVRSTETRLDNGQVDFAHPLPECTEYEQWNDNCDGRRHYHPHGQTVEDVRRMHARPPTQRQYPDGYGEEDDGGYVRASCGHPYQEATHDPRGSYDEEACSQRARPPQEPQSSGRSDPPCNPGPMTMWNSERAFAASTARMQNPSCSTCFNGPGFAQDEMPEVFAGSSSAPPPRRTTAYMITTPMTIQTRAYIRAAPVTPGVCQQRLPEKLPQLELGGDSYDYLMDLVTTIQAHSLDLDEWGAQGVMASVDVFYRGILAPYLHMKPSLSWPEVCETVWDLIKPLVTPEIAWRQLAEGQMDIYRPFLVFTQMFEKMRMLADVRKDSSEAHCYFLGSLD
ncbi:hypothetical protein H4R20_003427, partial [Coemansia guatemalensis]